MRMLGPSRKSPIKSLARRLPHAAAENHQGDVLVAEIDPLDDVTIDQEAGPQDDDALEAHHDDVHGVHSALEALLASLQQHQSHQLQFLSQSHLPQQQQQSNQKTQRIHGRVPVPR